MKKLMFIAVYALFLGMLSITAQNEPDGFASTSGNGLTTTTGGEGGDLVEVDNFTSLNLYATSSKPYIIIVKGLIESTTWREIKVNSNKTIVGYGTDATLKNIELNIINKKNIIIRNLIIRDSYVEGDPNGDSNDNDAIQADSTHHLWIDHCWFTHCGDGLIDLRKSCDNVTISYVHLSNHNKTFGLGWTTNTDWYVTVHHCWFDNTNQRNPSFDMGYGHLYNNYMSDIISYGNYCRGAAHLVVQNSFFENTDDPLTHSLEGYLYSSGNQFSDCTGDYTGNTSVMPYDPATFYEYTLDPTDQVKTIVIAQSGPQAGIAEQYLTTSIGELHNRNQIEYYYSQNQKSLIVNTNSEHTIDLRIFTYDGKMVLFKNICLSSSKEISLNELKSGMYLLQFEFDNTIENGKIILH